MHCLNCIRCLGLTFKKYKTFSVLIYSYINTSGNWKNEKLCGNTTPAGRSVLTQFRVFPVFTSVDITVYQYGKNVLYFFYNIAQRTLTEEWQEFFRVDIRAVERGGYPGLLPRGPGQKGARTQTVTNLQVLQDMK